MKLAMSLLILLSSSALAAKINEATCSDIATKTHKTVTPQYIAETEGFNAKGKEVFDEIDTSDIVSRANQVDAQCAKDLSAKVATVSKNQKNTLAANGKPTKINPLKSKCKEFVELDEEVQPLAVYWVAGHDKSGKLRKGGEFDEVFLEQPITELVQECKSHPSASFYAKTKNWVKKHI
jgi:hypothetical protein